MSEQVMSKSRIPLIVCQLQRRLEREEPFYTRHEAGVIVKGWRQRYNMHRPHRAPEYRPPAPESRTFAPISVSA